MYQVAEIESTCTTGSLMLGGNPTNTCFTTPIHYAPARKGWG